MAFDLRTTADSGCWAPQDCDVLLAESYAQAKNWNLAHRGIDGGSSPEGCFGVIAQTFPEWIEGIWELHGDGRRFATEIERLTIAERTLTERPLRYLVRTPNLSSSLALCAEWGLGTPSFERALECAVQEPLPASSIDGRSFSPAEWELLACVARYALTEQDSGLIGLGRALSYLADHAAEAFPHPINVCWLGKRPFLTPEERFFNAVDALHLTRIECRKQGKLEAIDRERVRFAFPSGQYAQPLSVLQGIDDILAEDPEGTIAIAAKRPFEMYRRISPALAERDRSVAVRAQRTFGETDFGKTYNSLAAVHRDTAPWNRDALTDVLHSSYLHLDKATVWKWDKRLRNDRLIDRSSVIAALRGGPSDGLPGIPTSSAQAFAELDDAVTRSAAGNLTRCKKQYRAIEGSLLSSADVHEQLLAIDVLEQVMEQAVRFGLADQTALDNVLAHSSFSVSRSTVPSEAGRTPQIIIMSQQQASQLAEESMAGLIVCDLTSESYPLAERQTATDLLLERFGIRRQTEPPLSAERRRFTALTKVPKSRLILERQLSNEAAEPLYPSAMWEEFVDAYRQRNAEGEPEPVDDLYRLPTSLMDRRIDSGEDDLFADVCPGRQQSLLDFSKGKPPARGNVGNQIPLVATPLPERDSDQEPCRLSPSQIDAYLDCPYRWFSSRRLGTEELDEGFGPAERGEFMHRIFQTFYRTFGEKVTPENIDRARECMFGEPDGVFESVRREQRSLAPLHRFAPLPGTTEEHEFDSLKSLVNDWLSFETTFLPAFTPVAFEYKVEDVPYAGALISGRIDRIDRDDKGRIVIIDYKGSLTSEYCALEADPTDADRQRFREHGKVQGLIYAAIIKQLGSLEIETPSGVEAIPVRDVVGALYVSYHKGNEVRGAYAADALGSAADLPTLKKADDCRLSSAGPLSFDALQSHAAARVRQAVKALRNGCVEPLPAHPDSCRFCPIFTCEERRA
ncbi:MAG: PD-(D/E)XK nuclease family protein [Eggerthellaceae bacterium]|jgi:ATP-dependent helicase/nuclease subunit B